MPASLIVLAARPPGWTPAQFLAWWRDEHAPFGRKLPHLIAYRHGGVVHDYDQPGNPGWDGHAVLTFPNRELLDQAMRSPQWAEALAHVGNMKGKRIVLITDEVDLLAGVPRDA